MRKPRSVEIWKVSIQVMKEGSLNLCQRKATVPDLGRTLTVLGTEAGWLESAQGHCRLVRQSYTIQVT